MTIAEDAGTAADSETASLLKTWVEGWAASRACAPPIAHGEGWRVEVGWPEQVRRHVFPRESAALRALGEAIDEPWSYLKACLPADRLRTLLPPRWTVQAQTYFMVREGAPPPMPPLAPGYALDVVEEGGVHTARILAEDGTLAADGHMVVIDGAAIFDRIGTHADHRRRGLGRVVMGALHDVAAARGETRGLLAATQDGHALYRTMGWRVQSPYASAVILPA